MRDAEGRAVVFNFYVMSEGLAAAAQRGVRESCID